MPDCIHVVLDVLATKMVEPWKVCHCVSVACPILPFNLDARSSILANEAMCCDLAISSVTSVKPSSYIVTMSVALATENQRKSDVSEPKKIYYTLRNLYQAFDEAIFLSAASSKTCSQSTSIQTRASPPCLCYHCSFRSTCVHGRSSTRTLQRRC